MASHVARPRFQLSFHPLVRSVTGTLHARLLGEPLFTWEGSVVAPPSRKGAALLALLASRADGVDREELAELLWGPGKLASVRQALYELRRQPGAQEWLVDEQGWVRLEVVSDLAEFERAALEGDAGHALGLYAGQFLEGYDSISAPAFQDWLAQERDRLAQLHLRALRSEADRLEGEGRFAAAKERVKEALEADPLNESHYRAAMRLAYVLGEVESATDLFRRCVRMMRQEYRSEPSRETRELAAAIERGQPLPLSADLNELPLPHLRLLQALAVAGGDLGVEGTATVLERPSFDVAADLAVLEARGLADAHVSVNPAYLAQVLASTPMSLRRLLHERTAEVLLNEPDVDEAVVARHLLSAGNRAAAAPRFLRAAHAALERADLPAAVTLLFRLLWADDGSEGDTLRLEGCLLLEGAAAQLGDEPLQEAALEEAERLAWQRQSDPHLADVRLRRSRQLLRKGQRGEALELALEALEIGVRLGDGTLVARARNGVGGAQFYSGDLDGAVESFTMNLETEDAVERFRALNNLGTLAAIRGDLAESYRRFEQALTLARASASRAEVAATLNNLAATAERRSDYGRAVRHFRDGIDLARRNQAHVMEGQLLNNLAVVYIRQGELGPAWNTVDEVEELATEMNDVRLLMHVPEQQAEVLRVCGLFDEAIVCLERALEYAEALGDERKVLVLRSQLATERYLRGGGTREEAEEALEALSVERITDIAPWLWIEMALVARDPEEVEALLRRAGEHLQNRHMRLLADIARLRAALLHSEGGAGAEAADVVARLTGEARHPEETGDEVATGLSEPVVERPYAWWLLERWAERTEGGAGGRVPARGPSARIVAELRSQGQGLPKRLRESLLRQPERWEADLEGDPRRLTVF